MKSFTFFITLIILSGTVQGQQETEASKTAANQFELQYNSGDTEGIFNSFAEELQRKLPLEKTREFLANLHTQMGDMTGKEFKGYEKTYASYIARFQSGALTMKLSVDEQSRINGLLFQPLTEVYPSESSRNTTPLILPFHEEWTVVWGGDTKEQNYHVSHKAQKHAFDLVITDKLGLSYRTEGKTNEDYYAFGKEIIAPCAAEVVLVVDGVKDNIPGELNPVYVPGNTVILKTGNNEFLFFAHFRQHSIRVKQGQKVKQGQLLGLCGNSGNSSEPHLHFHIQDSEFMHTASGIKCYFEKLLVNGTEKTDYSPVQHEKIRNAGK